MLNIKIFLIIGIIEYDAFIFGVCMTKILEALINNTADEWNTRVSISMGIPISVLKDMIISRELKIAETKLNISVDKRMIEDISKDQIQEDLDTRIKIVNGDTDSIYNPSLLEKYVIKIKTDNEQLVEAIALTGKFLIGIDFSESDLSNSYLCGCLFYNCSFKRTSLESSVITGCIFNSCDFTDCDLTGSTIARTQIYESVIVNTIFEYNSITDCVLLNNTGDNATFIQSKILFTGIADSQMPGCDFKDTDIVQCTIVNSDLNKSDFKRCTLVDSILMRSDFTGCDMSSLMVTCITQSKCKYDSKYSTLFEMDKLLYNPALFEWESEEETPTSEETWE